MNRSNLSESTIGYIILENDAPAQMKNIEVVDKPHLFYVKFDTVLQSTDVENRNHRIYAGNALKTGLSDPNLSELMAQGKWHGEAGHPITKDIARIATVDPKCTSHKINKWWTEGNLIMGNVETLDDGMFGTKLAKSILQGVTPSFSLRALAMLSKKGSTTHVNKPPRVITYDEVILPSHKEAYAKKESFKNILQTNDNFTVQNGSIAIEAADIKDYIENKSDNLKIVCESFDIDPDSINILSNNKISVKREGITCVFALENHIAYEIADMWSRFNI